jgi:hypothetical protein
MTRSDPAKMLNDNMSKGQALMICLALKKH